ncbi:MAG: response regulator, partial [Bacteroides sp.]|nr:response regulator [Bacteroides sp.]
GVLYVDNNPESPRAFVSVTSRQGLCNDVVQSILEDDNGQIVVGTENGCSYYNPEKGSLYNHYITEHPLNNFYNEQCAVKLSDGRLVFGTYNGIVTVNKELSIPNHQTKELALTNLYINGTSLYNFKDSIYPSVSEINRPGHLELDHDQNSVTAYFSDFNYTTNWHTSYSYKLEGYDEDWSEPTVSNFVSYRTLPPGEYTLSVRYKGEYSQWSPSIKNLHLTILSPWWKTWWAVTLYVLAGIIVGLIVYRQLHTVYVLRQSIKFEKKLTEYKLVFFTNISHEFRTPLTLIQNAMERLKSVENIPSEMKLPVSNMEKSVDRMLRLVNQLLEFRRMQNNKLSLSLQQTNIIAFLYNIYISFHQLAQSRNVEYKFITTVQDFSVYIDRSFIDKVVYNLLSNAFKYTPKGGSILLRIDTGSPRWVSFTIEDTGAGISKAKQKELFSRFSTEKLKEGSIGIGLHFIHELVKTHHGNIRFNENPGGGSIFCVELPADKEVYADKDFMKTDTVLQEDLVQDTKKGFALEYKENIPAPMNDKEILVVEDDNDIAEMLRHEFCAYFKVSVANDGQEALEYLQGHPSVSLVISDVVMPRMDGFELLRRLKHNKQLSTTPFVILTALTTPDKQEKGFVEGADAFVPKPFNSKILLAQCYRIIQQREQMHSAASQTEGADKSQPLILYREEKEKKFIEQLDLIIGMKMDDNTLNVEMLAVKFGYSRTKFYNKVKLLTGKTPNEYLKDKRLAKGAGLLLEGNLTVSQIAYQVGFTTPQYFATNFKQKYGMTPRDYQRNKAVESGA